MERARWRAALRWGERLLIVAVAGFVAWRLAPQVSAWTGVGSADRPAPELSARTLDGRRIDAADMAGRVVVVNFWATWCPPCRLELPALRDLHREHAGEGLLVLGLSIDDGKAAVERFLERRELDLPVAMADAGHRRAFGGVEAVPTTILIGRDGRVRHRVEGLFAPPALKAAVRRLLAEPPPAPAGGRPEADGS